MKRLIITADEFGQSNDVNEAIHELYINGFITNTVLMPNMDATGDAISIAKKHEIKTGIHFNLTEGKPLMNKDEVKSLVDGQGYFYKPLTFLFRYFTGRIKIDDIERELRAQFNRLKEEKIILTHFDGHCYINMLPGVLKIMIEVTREKGLNKTRLADEKWSYEIHGFFPLFTYNFFRKFSTSLMARKIKDILDKNKIRHANKFFGIMMIDSDEPLKHLIRTLDLVGEGYSELMVHPGLENEKRKMEYNALKSDLFRNRLKEKGIELVSYSEL